MKFLSILSALRRTSMHSFAASLVCVFATVSVASGQASAPRVQPSPVPNAAQPARAVSVTNLPGDAPAQVDQRAIDSTIAEDANILRALADYRTRVAALNKPIARLDAAIEKRGIGGGGVGNFVADAMRAEASRRTKRSIPLAIINTGGLRKNSISAGTLTTSDIYELLPFENSLVLVELTGEQLLRLLAEVTKARDAQSGAEITYTADAEERSPRLDAVMLVRAGGGHGARVSPNRTYRVVTIDYLVNRGGNYAVLKEAKRTTPLNVTVRDSVIEHLRREEARGRTVTGKLDGRFRHASNTKRTAQGVAQQGVAQ